MIIFFVTVGNLLLALCPERFTVAVRMGRSYVPHGSSAQRMESYIKDVLNLP